MRTSNSEDLRHLAGRRLALPWRPWMGVCLLFWRRSSNFHPTPTSDALSWKCDEASSAASMR
jgi:hypothetical protein